MTTKIHPKSKRRFLRFTLRCLLLVILVVCVGLGWKVERVRKQRDAVNWVQQFRGRGVDYDYERDDSGRPIPDAEPTRPKWLMEQLGIDFFHDVVRVNLTNKEQVSDVLPLASLTSLEVLQLDGTQVSDLTPLAGLTNVKKLYLSSTPVSDVTALSGLKRLEVLRLDGTHVSDVTPLGGLTNLKSLYLDGAQVSLNPLPEWWTGPDVLRLDGTQLSDVTALSGLTSLEVLQLDGTQVSDVTPLAALTNLKMLSLRNTPVSEKAWENLQRALPQCTILGAPTTHRDTLLEPTRENDRPMSIDEWHQHEMPWRPPVPKVDKGLYTY